MKKMGTLFKKTWFITLLAVLSLSLLVWFLAPLLDSFQSVSSRLIIIGILFFLWAVFVAIHLWREKRKDKKMLEDIADIPVDVNEQASKEEVEQLNQRMQDALSELKDSALGSGAGKQSLYQLPWYVIIGPPGAGKTTLLANSNLHFPLSKKFGKEAIRGVGGTRNCDWWFTDEAVLLDTAGRYVTQDSNQAVDNKGWLGFLDLLKKHRSRRPINGVMIAISIEDLLQKDEKARLKEAQTIRERVQELYGHFNLRFPVYVMFTKCDLLAGFNDYFDHMGRDERSQVWGMTFPFDDDQSANNKDINLVDAFNTEFQLLEKRLHQQIIPQLEAERDEARRQSLYLFPQQFSALKGLIEPFLQEAFRSTRYQHTAMLRGAYFTSATQEGSPIDRIMSTLSRTFNMQPQRIAATPQKGKSFFINHLLERVIFHESGLAGTNTKFEKKLQWIRRGVLAAIGTVSVLLIIAWLTSFFSNRSMINDFEQQTAELNQLVKAYSPKDSLLERLAMLDKARNLPSGYHDKYDAIGALKDEVPLKQTFGLYQGDQLGDSAISKYQALLASTLLSPVLLDLEQKMRDDLENPAALFRVLRVYLMLKGSNRNRYDGESVMAFVKPRLDPNNELHQHLTALFLTKNAETGKAEQPLIPRKLDKVLIAKARANLEGSNLAKLVYYQAKEDLIATTTLPAFTVQEAVGTKADEVFVRRNPDKSLNDGISGLFTYKGYHTIFKEESKKIAKNAAGMSWVLNAKSPNTGEVETEKAIEQENKKEFTKLKKQILTFYFDDYIKEWEGLLEDLAIKPLQDLDDASTVFALIAKDKTNKESLKNSPLVRLLTQVNTNTRLDSAEGAVGKAVGDKLNKAANRASGKVGLEANNGNANRAAQQQLVSPARVVSEHFEKLNALTQGKDAATMPLNKVLGQLAIINKSIAEAANTQELGDEIPAKTRDKIKAGIIKFKKTAKNQLSYSALNKMIMEMLKNVERLLLTVNISQADTVWKNDILPFCQSSIQGKYPIGNSGTITLQDFEAFFAPNGKIDGFFKDYLAASINTSNKDSWTWKEGSGANQPSIAAEKIEQFRLANNIRDAFFPTGKLGIPFTVKALSGGNKDRVFSLDIDGTVIKNDIKGKQASMKWPNQGNEQIISQLFITETIPVEEPTLPPMPPNNGEEGGGGNTVVVISPPKEPKKELKTYDGNGINGPWAIFRLLERKGKKVNDNTYRFTLNIQGRTARFELKAKSTANNPFKMKQQELNLFNCPSSLL